MYLGNDQYPKRLAEANHELSNHHFYLRQKKNSKGNHQETTKDKDSDNTRKLTFAQMEGKCYCCGKEAINLPNVIIRTDPRKNGQKIRQRLRN